MWQPSRDDSSSIPFALSPVVRQPGADELGLQKLLRLAGGAFSVCDFNAWYAASSWDVINFQQKWLGLCWTSPDHIMITLTLHIPFSFFLHLSFLSSYYFSFPYKSDTDTFQISGNLHILREWETMSYHSRVIGYGQDSQTPCCMTAEMTGDCCADHYCGCFA